MREWRRGSIVFLSLKSVQSNYSNGAEIIVVRRQVGNYERPAHALSTSFDQKLVTTQTVNQAHFRNS